MKIISRWLDRTTMYRLVLYYLIALVVIASGLAATGHLPYKASAIVVAAIYTSLVCWVANLVFSKVYKAPANIESPLITALILVLIITPIDFNQNIVFLTAAGGLAMASKYILAIRKRHIFNPAAVAVALTAVGAGQSASWWVGNQRLLPFVLIGGLLVIIKIQRIQMVLSFFVAVLLSTVVYAHLGSTSVSRGLHQLLLQSSLFFFAFVMLTEPLTSPSTHKKQRWYGALAGVLFPPQVHLLGIYSTPELVLVVSNIFSYVVNPKLRLLPSLVGKHKLSPSTLDFVFSADQKVPFKPGQYMEWTLPHSRSDSRGNRRYFTMASSPTEKDLRLGIKFYQKGSSFKKAMLSMDATTPIAADHPSGDFVMPENQNQKLAFIAGGIGVTPFRSMIKYLIDTNDPRSITMLYSEKNADELVYKDVFEEARQKLNHKIVYTLTQPAGSLPANSVAGMINAQTIKVQIPDYQERLFYISGPHSMVSAMTEILSSLGVNKRQIKTDFFPGYT